jgi:hypothetical protein
MIWQTQTRPTQAAGTRLFSRDFEGMQAPVQWETESR